MDSNRHVEVTALISNNQVVQAIRNMILDNEDFDFRYWSIDDAETFERAANQIREGYQEMRDRIAREK